MVMGSRPIAVSLLSWSSLKGRMMQLETSCAAKLAALVAVAAHSGDLRLLSGAALQASTSSRNDMMARSSGRLAV
jgi:hypothetical protein